MAAIALASTAWAAQGEPRRVAVNVDPVTRYVHVSYRLPINAPEVVTVLCSWSPAGKNDWRAARVRPLISETALQFVPAAEWKQWHERGRIIERRATGLMRTVVFNPYPEAQQDGRVDVEFRIQVQSTDGKPLSTLTARVRADNTDVVTIEDWSRAMQRGAVVAEAEHKGRKWSWRTGLKPDAGLSLGNGLVGTSDPDVSLPQLSYALDLRGPYAIFVRGAEGIRMRLTGDERADIMSSGPGGTEVLWRWGRMDRQHLVLKQRHAYTGWVSARIDYVRLVPLTQEQVEKLESQFGGKPDKIIAGYWEPYSWAFHDRVRETLQHREPLTAFAEARVGIVDTQIGRFGMKVVYESRKTDPLFYATIGDPIGKVARPTTDNVGKMQQYTNTLDATLRYARELGLRAHANFGASNCYPGSPLRGDFSKTHPDWMRGSALRYEVPEVRQYVLRLYREALEIGAPGISIDYCRYPETVDTVETGNTMMRALRKLADEFGKLRGERVPILTRFPGKGVRRCKLFDYATWAREGWVDYLCPSNIQGRHHHIDVGPYLSAVRGTTCKLLPCVDGLSWGLPMPGPFLWRVARLYEAGVDGIYVYQADARVLGRPRYRRCMRTLPSSQAVRDWWDRDKRHRPRCSKGIYITPPNRPMDGYHGWERLRVWVEGIAMGPLEIHLDGKVVNRFDGPPYLLGTEEYASDRVIPPGEHKLRIRAKDGDGWLEQTFTIRGAK